MAKMQFVIIAYDENGDSTTEPFYQGRIEVAQEELCALTHELTNFRRRWEHRRERNTLGRVPK